MAMSRRENEIKLAFPSAGAAIRALDEAGATRTHPRTFEDNVLYDRRDRTIELSGRILRLRVYGRATVLTLKGPPLAGRHKVRAECETKLTDAAAMRTILEELGYAPVYRYQKYRTMFRLGALTAVVDETPLGTFVELEGEPDDVDRAARSLGFDESDYVRATYRELQVRDAQARGVTPGDMLMPAGGARR